MSAREIDAREIDAREIDARELGPVESALVTKVRTRLSELGGRRSAVSEAKNVTDVMARHMQLPRHALRAPTRPRALDHYCASYDDVLRDLGRRTSSAVDVVSSVSGMFRRRLRRIGVSDAVASLLQLAYTIRHPAYRYQKFVPIQNPPVHRARRRALSLSLNVYVCVCVCVTM
jgi:hypothetical protein